MSTSPNLHGMSDAACITFDRLVACPFPGCDDGDVDGEPCETCGGTGRVMPPPPALPAMPQPARVSAAEVRREHDPIRALVREHERRNHLFEVWRTVDGERDSCLAQSHELNEEEIAGLSPEDRAHYEADEARWETVWPEVERLAAEEEVARWRDGEAAVASEPDPRTVAECAAAAAE